MLFLAGRRGYGRRGARIRLFSPPSDADDQHHEQHPEPARFWVLEIHRRRQHNGHHWFPGPISTHVNEKLKKFLGARGGSTYSLSKIHYIRPSVLRREMCFALDGPSPFDFGISLLGTLMEAWPCRELRAMCSLVMCSDVMFVSGADSVFLDNAKNQSLIARNEGRVGITEFILMVIA